MQLTDTIKLMQSADYKDRFLAEYWQLRIRAYKLYKMIEKYQKGELDFTPDCPIEVLRAQYRNMVAYMTILEERADIEGINLYDYGNDEDR